MSTRQDEIGRQEVVEGTEVEINCGQRDVDIFVLFGRVHVVLVPKQLLAGGILVLDLEFPRQGELQLQQIRVLVAAGGTAGSVVGPFGGASMRELQRCSFGFRRAHDDGEHRVEPGQVLHPAQVGEADVSVVLLAEAEDGVFVVHVEVDVVVEFEFEAEGGLVHAVFPKGGKVFFDYFVAFRFDFHSGYGGVHASGFAINLFERRRRKKG